MAARTAFVYSRSLFAGDKQSTILSSVNLITQLLSHQRALLQSAQKICIVLMGNYWAHSYKLERALRLSATLGQQLVLPLGRISGDIK